MSQEEIDRIRLTDPELADKLQRQHDDFMKLNGNTNLNEIAGLNKKLVDKMYKGYSPKKAGGLIKDFRKGKGTQNLIREDEKNKENLLKQQQAYDDLVLGEDDDGRLIALRKK